MVSIKCQSQYNALLLARCSLVVTWRRSRGAGDRAPSRPGPKAPRPPALPSESERRANGRAAVQGGGVRGPAAPRPQGRAAEADTRITLLQAPGSGDGDGRRGWELRRRRTPFPLPSLSAGRVTSLYGQRKKIIKKTYKITIEKVILLGEAPLRLRGAFVLF